MDGAIGLVDVATHSWTHNLIIPCLVLHPPPVYIPTRAPKPYKHIYESKSAKKMAPKNPDFFGGFSEPDFANFMGEKYLSLVKCMFLCRAVCKWWDWRAARRHGGSTNGKGESWRTVAPGPVDTPSPLVGFPFIIERKEWRMKWLPKSAWSL